MNQIKICKKKKIYFIKLKKNSCKIENCRKIEKKISENPTHRMTAFRLTSAFNLLIGSSKSLSI